jgi:hypothetical protein
LGLEGQISLRAQSINPLAQGKGSVIILLVVVSIGKIIEGLDISWILLDFHFPVLDDLIPVPLFIGLFATIRKFRHVHELLNSQRYRCYDFPDT